MRTDALRVFLDSPQAHRRRSVLPETSASDVIVADLEQRLIAVNR
jgi:hypothetical protein